MNFTGIVKGFSSIRSFFEPNQDSIKIYAKLYGIISSVGKGIGCIGSSCYINVKKFHLFKTKNNDVSHLTNEIENDNKDQLLAGMNNVKDCIQDRGPQRSKDSSPPVQGLSQNDTVSVRRVPMVEWNYERYFIFIANFGLINNEQLDDALKMYKMHKDNGKSIEYNYGVGWVGLLNNCLWRINLISLGFMNSATFDNERFASFFVTIYNDLSEEDKKNVNFPSEDSSILHEGIQKVLGYKS